MSLFSSNKKLTAEQWAKAYSAENIAQGHATNKRKRIARKNKQRLQKLARKNNR